MILRMYTSVCSTFSQMFMAGLSSANEMIEILVIEGYAFGAKCMWTRNNFNSLQKAIPPFCQARMVGDHGKISKFHDHGSVATLSLV